MIQWFIPKPNRADQVALNGLNPFWFGQQLKGIKRFKTILDGFFAKLN